MTKASAHYQISCPHCGKQIELGESAYDSIVRTASEEGAERERALLANQHEKDLKRAVELAHAEAANQFQATMNQAEKAANETQAQLSARIAELQGRLDAAESEKDLALKGQEAEAAGKIKLLEQEVEQLKAQAKADKKAASSEKEAALAKAQQKSQEEMAHLQQQLTETKADCKRMKAEHQSTLLHEKEMRESLLREKEEELERLRTKRALRTTKEVGEDLERWCKKEFDKHRATMFPRAQFEKDTKVVNHSQGDFIYRECDEDGDEILSIMFEMKTEQETASKKHRNEEFYKELDKDRNNHGCEFAVLVTELEPDNDLYDSPYQVYQYDKMYAVRPESFIAFTGLLRSMALDKFADRKAMLLDKRANIDVAHFYSMFDQASAGFAKTFDNAMKQRQKAIKQLEAIEKAAHGALEALRLEEKHLRTSQKKLEALSPSTLSKGNETIKAMFAEYEEQTALPPAAE